MNTLKAEKRTMDIKAKKLRREGYVTGNLFGKKIENSIPIKIQKTEVYHLLKTDHKGSQVTLDVDGTTYNALIKDVEYNAQTGNYDEIDFQALVSDEKVSSVAEIEIIGHDEVSEGVLQVQLEEIAYKALPAALLDKVEVDVSEMKIGDSIRVKDLAVAKNKDIDLITDLDAMIATVGAVHNQVEETEASEEKAETTEEA